MTKSVAVLPYVSTQPFRFGGFDIWPNQKTFWIKHVGVDNTDFAKIFRRRDGTPVERSASVATRRRVRHPSVDKFAMLAAGLSTVAWLERRVRPADAFIHEIWELPTTRAEKKRWFARHAKFSLNITSAEFDRVYPPPQLTAQSLQMSDPDIRKYVERIILRPDSGKARALTHFYFARFETTFFTSLFQDVASLWAGFEAFLTIPRKPVKRSRKALVLARLTKRLQPLRLPPDAVDAIAASIDRLYELRNVQAHGLIRDWSKFRLEHYGIGAYEVGLQLAETLLRIECFGGNGLITEFTSDQLVALLTGKPSVERLAGLLRGNRRDWYPGTAAGEKKVADLEDALDRVTSRYLYPRRYWEGDPKLARAGQTMGLVLSDWVKVLQSDPSKGSIVAPIAWLPSEISRLVQEGYAPPEIDVEIAKRLADENAFEATTFRANRGAVPPDLLIHGTIPVWKWVSGYVRLAELRLGYVLR